MKEQHTPGLWNHDEYGHICAGPQIIGIAYQHELDDSDNDPLPCLLNARLMAAAPELLQALQELHEAGLTMKLPRYVIARDNAKRLIDEHTNEK